MTKRALEIREAYTKAIKAFGIEKANEILGIILNTEIAHQNLTEQMAEAIRSEIAA